MVGICWRIPWKPRDVLVHVTGCYIIIRSCLNQFPITLVGVYIPSAQQAIFWEDLFSKVNVDTPYLKILGISMQFGI